METSRRAHVRCGSDIRGALAQAGIEGDFIEISDPVCQGPVPLTEDDMAFRRVRAEFVSANFDGFPLETACDRMQAEADSLASLGGYDEITLWYEHDLYDQAALIRLLHEVGRDGLPWERMSLVSINRHPSVERFTGFGMLSPEHFPSLHARRVPVTATQLRDASGLWNAYRGEDPLALIRLGVEAAETFPFIAAAIRRHLQKLPSTGNGLGLAEQLALDAIAGGADTPGKMFGRLVDTLDPQPYMGDLMLWPIVRRLAETQRPALTPFKGVRAPIALTAFGEALHAGNADWVRENGLDRWVGGIRLDGKQAPWRWDEDAAAPVPGP